jgi:hypothetical protein
MLKEMLALLIGSIPIFAAMNPLGFSMTCLGAVVLASLFWWLCSFHVRLWNLSFALNWFHLLLSTLAAGCTIFIVIAFVSVSEIGYAFNRIVSEWGDQLHSLAESADNSFGISSDAELEKQFEAAHPFLGGVLSWASSTTATDSRDVDSAVDGAEVKPDGETIDQTVSDLRASLQSHVHTVVLRLRALLLAVLFSFQGAVFFVTGYAAQRAICPSYVA